MPAEVKSNGRVEAALCRSAQSVADCIRARTCGRMAFAPERRVAEEAECDVETEPITDIPILRTCLRDCRVCRRDGGANCSEGSVSVPVESERDGDPEAFLFVRLQRIENLLFA